MNRTTQGLATAALAALLAVPAARTVALGPAQIGAVLAAFPGVPPAAVIGTPPQDLPASAT